MKLVHISDLHINTSIPNNNIDKTDFLLSEIAKTNPDHLVVTGDLTDNADPGDLRIARNLLAKHGFSGSEKLTVIAGNHDIFGGVQSIEDIVLFPERCRSVDYNSKIREFHSVFSSTLDNSVYVSANCFYPFAKIIKEVLFIALNSVDIYSKLRNPFASNGFVTPEQMDEIRYIISTFKKDVRSIAVLIHHHFYKLDSESESLTHSLWQRIEGQTLKLRKRKRLLKFLGELGVQAIFHGHVHEQRDYSMKGLRIVNSGGSVYGMKKQNVFYNLAMFEKNNIGVEIRKYKFKPETEPFKNKLLDFLPGIKENLVIEQAG